MQLSIAAIHLDEARFSHIPDLLSAMPTGQAASHFSDIEVQVLEDDAHESVAVRLTAKSGAGSKQYVFLIRYVIIFNVSGERPEDFQKRIAATGAHMLLPFVRELVGSLSGRGRFGPVWINPVNFAEAAAPPARKRGRAPKKESPARRGTHRN
jgi:preprotein translocase subunit SecB